MCLSDEGGRGTDRDCPTEGWTNGPTGWAGRCLTVLEANPTAVMVHQRVSVVHPPADRALFHPSCMCAQVQDSPGTFGLPEGLPLGPQGGVR